MDRTTGEKLARLYFIFGVFTFLLGCSTINFFEKEAAQENSVQRQFDRDEIASARWEAQVNSGKFTNAINEIPAFLKERAGTQHWYPIMFTYGRAKEGVEDWEGAIQAYREIVERSNDQQMEFVALAFYRMAYCYEVRLENERALAALHDSAKLQSYLPLEISLAEIPARIASIHARLNQPQLADVYTRKADSGLRRLRGMKKGTDPEWISRTLLRMGSLSLSPVDAESFKQNVQTLIRNQRYLVQTIEINNPRLAQEAEKLLVSTYANLWNFIDTYRVSQSPDWESDIVKEARKKTDFLSIYLEAIEILKSYRSPEDSSTYALTLPTFQKIEDLEVKAIGLLNQEMLKRPWQGTLKNSSTEVIQNLKSSPKPQAIDVDSELNSKNIPQQLPKKKIK